MNTRLLLLLLTLLGLVMTPPAMRAEESSISEGDGQASVGDDEPSDCTNYKVVPLCCGDCGECDDAYAGPDGPTGDTGDSGMTSVATSIVDNITFNHVHTATEWEVASPSGCASCGSAPGATANLPRLVIKRYHRYRDVTEHSSFGPGVFSNFDISLSLAPNLGGARARVFQPLSSIPLLLDDGTYGDVRDGIFRDGLRSCENNRSIRDLRLYTGVRGTGSLTASFTAAHSAVMTTLHGRRYIFDIVDLGSPQGAGQSLGNDPWLHLDVGRVGWGGTASYANGQFTVKGAGNDIWNTNDQFHYAYQAMHGDGTISAQVLSLDAITAWEKGGVMIRESLNESARFAAMYATPGAGAAFQWRSTWGGGCGGVSGGTLTVPYADTTLAPVALSAVKAPCWVRIVRSGSTLTGQVSLDNQAWTTVGTQTIAFNQDVYVGLAVCSHVPAALATGVFASVAMTGAPTPAGSWPPTDLYHDIRGRIARIEELNGYGLDVAYQYNPAWHPATTVAQQNVILAAPDLQWEIDRISDPTGQQVVVGYQPGQVSGQWAIATITVPNGGQIRYSYGADGQIAGIAYPDGTASTFTRSYEPISQCTVVGYDDAGTTGIHRRKKVYLSNNFSQHVDGSYESVYNQSSLLVRMVVNGAGEVAYLNAFAAGNWSSWWIYEGTGRLRVMGPTVNRYYQPGWKHIAGKTGSAAWTGSQEPTYYSRDLGGNWTNYSKNTPVAITSPTGVRKTYQYDADHVMTQVGWADGSVRSLAYNGNKQITREVDRLGRVTLTAYDANGNRTSRETGILVVGGVDTPQADHAVEQWAYYPDGDPNQRLLAAAIDADGNRTDYAYDAQHRLIAVSEPADVANGPRATTRYTYDAAGRLASASEQTDFSGDPTHVRVTTYAYDARDRVSTIGYADGSSERFVYGAPGTPDANLLVKRFNRNGVATAYAYDAAGRRTQVVEAAAQIVNGSEQAITDPAIRHVETMTYLKGTELVASRTVAGNLTAIAYDTHQREVTRTIYPRSGAGLTTAQTYVNNLLFSTTDPYGRISYNVYRAADALVVRTVRGLLPTFTAATAALPTLARDPAVNPAYVIEDLNRDAAGQITSLVDGRGTTTAYAYDDLGRVVAQTEDATGTPASTAFAYDPAGNRLSTTSPRGVVTAMTYTGRNLLATVTEAAGTPQATLVRTLSYTPTRKPATETDANGNLTAYTYGVCCDRLVTITDPAGFTTRFAYDPYGNRLSATDGNNLTTATAYDARNRVASVTNAAGETTAYAYDESLVDGIGVDAAAAVQPVLAGLGLSAGLAEGSAVAMTNPNHETSYELRDGLGRPVARIDGLGHATTIVYDAKVNNLVETTTTDALGHATKARSDGAGRVREAVDALAKVAAAGFDAVGNQVSARDANAVGWNAGYDPRNRMTGRSDTGGGSTGWTYDLDGNRLSETDALGKAESYGYDQRNRRTDLTDRLGGITRFAYDAVGNLVRISDADNEAKGGLGNLAGTTQYGYDVRNLLVAEAFPSGQAGRTLRTYAYDGGRRLTGRSVGILAGVFANPLAFAGTAESTAYAYDAANRLTTRSYADGLHDSFAYDPASRLTTAASGRYADTVARAYDAAGRLMSESLTLPDGSLGGTTVSPATYTVSYTYDAANRLTGLAYPTGTAVTRSYSVRNELTGVSMGGASVATRTYDAGGRLTATAFGDGLSETRTYVPGDVLVASMQTAPAAGGAVVSGYTYTYDADKRKLSETDVATGQTQTFAYDDASRLTGWNRSGGGPAPSAQSWNLSLVGDWTSTTRDGVAEPRVNSAVHEAVQVGTNLLGYDAKGNLARDEHGNALAWDPENRLTRALITPDASTTGAGAIATYRYDALGRRIAKTVQNRTTLYLDAGAQTVVEIDRTAIPTQADMNGATADGTLANAAMAPASGGILPTEHGAVTRINFQPATTAIPAGFLADKGKVSGVRTNGLTYGWSSDVTAQAVERDAASLVEFDTFVQAQTDTTSSSWSITLPNGTYPVVVVAGDAASLNQTDNLVIGGVAVTDATPAGYVPSSSGEQGNFDGYAVAVTVSNGVLTIAPGSGAFHAKLCFVEIGTADTVANVAATIAAAQSKLAALVTKMNDLTAAPVEPVAKVREYAYLGYVDEVGAFTQSVNGAASRYCVHSNHQYSPAALASATGAVVERMQYDAYGKQTITSGAGAALAKSGVGFDRAFTGYVTDREIGLCYARNRYYSSMLGSYLSRDQYLRVFGWNHTAVLSVPHSVVFANQLTVLPGPEYMESFGSYAALIGLKQWLDPSGMQQDPVAGSVFAETGGLRPAWKDPNGEKKKANYDPDSVKGLADARERIAGIADKDPGRVAPPSYPSDQDLQNPNTKDQWDLAKDASKNKKDPGGEDHFVIWSSKDGKKPDPGIPSDWPYTQEDKISAVYGPFRNVQCKEPYYIFFYKGVK